jgi:hypothetical protein
MNRQLGKSKPRLEGKVAVNQRAEQDHSGSGGAQGCQSRNECVGSARRSSAQWFSGKQASPLRRSAASPQQESLRQPRRSAQFQVAALALLRSVKQVPERSWFLRVRRSCRQEKPAIRATRRHKTRFPGLVASLFVTRAAKRSTDHRQNHVVGGCHTEDAAHNQIMRALQHSIRTMGLRACPSAYVFF